MKASLISSLMLSLCMAVMIQAQGNDSSLKEDAAAKDVSSKQDSKQEPVKKDRARKEADNKEPDKKAGPQKDPDKKDATKKDATKKDTAKKETSEDKDSDQEKSVAAFMQRKLELAQLALDGLVNEEFGDIKKAATELEKMGQQPQWNVIEEDEYTHFSAEFRRLAKALTKQAEQKSIDGAALAYVQLTMSCVECHKFTRRVRMADAAPLKLKPVSFKSVR